MLYNIIIMFSGAVKRVDVIQSGGGYCSSMPVPVKMFGILKIILN